MPVVKKKRAPAKKLAPVKRAAAKLTGKVGEIWWHVHHGSLAESLYERVEERRSFVRLRKGANEIPTRIKWMKPVKNQTLAKLLLNQVDRWGLMKPKARKDLEVLHGREHPKCPWNGHALTFPREK